VRWHGKSVSARKGQRHYNKKSGANPKFLTSVYAGKLWPIGICAKQDIL